MEIGQADFCIILQTKVYKMMDLCASILKYVCACFLSAVDMYQAWKYYSYNL